jgi:alpha-galactosidase
MRNAMDNTLDSKILKPSLDFARKWAEAVTGGTGANPRKISVQCLRQGWGAIQIDRSLVNEPLKLAGKVYKRGLGTHADSEIRIRARQPIRAFRAWAGMDDNTGCRNANAGTPGRLLFAVEAGGRELWRSAALGVASKPVRVDVAAGGATELVLKVWDANGKIDWGHADWADAEIELADGTKVRPAAGDPVFPAQVLVDGLLPFSFQYGGRPASELIPGWKRSETGSTKAGVSTRELTWHDPKTGLECVLELQTFAKFPAVEWVMRFRNTGNQDTPLLEEIRPLDMEWAPDKDRSWTSDETLLRRSCGSQCKPTDFQYRIDPLPAGSTIAMAAGGGRSSNNWVPFFNLQSGKSGVMVGIGWSGQWAAEFARPTDATLRIRAGQELTKLKLHPGEEIRTPRMLLVFWNGEPQTGHNLLRRFLLAHHVPKTGGRPIEAPVCAATWGGMESVHHLQQIQDIRKHRLAYDYYWIDAGWYGPEGSFSPDVYTGEWAKYVGHWNINPRAHPNGLRPLADAAHAAGMKFLLWLEPERALAGTPWTVEHPEWFLGEHKPGANLLFNLGDPVARQWLTEFISNFLRDTGIDCYRQDFNFDPLPYWRAADAPDRQGMAEIRYVEGHYQFWDELLRRHPGLLIDNCSSGGRRIDLETVSRSIPLWRSDYQCLPDFDPAGCQTQTHGLSYWVPLHGCGTCGGTHDPRRGDTYNVRSNLSASLEFPIYFNQGDGRADHPWDWQRRMIEEYRRARPMFYGDYYPLTGDTGAADTWVAMQFHRPDLGEGILLAFRRKESPFESAKFRLRALDPAASYELTDADTRRKHRAKGRDLIEKGLPVAMETAPSSRLVFYRKIKL